MQIAYILIGIIGFCVGALGFFLGQEIKDRSNAIEKQNDVMAGWMSGTTTKLTELERRLHCVEEDLEKIPVEEVNAEVQRLELFNDGIANIMGYGPDVPKLNKEVLKHE
jgi:hypothetical protein